MDTKVSLLGLLKLVKEGKAPPVVKYYGVKYYRDTVNNDYIAIDTTFSSNMLPTPRKIRGNLILDVMLHDTTKTIAEEANQNIELCYPVLDGVEKNYLGALIKPFRRYVTGIYKRTYLIAATLKKFNVICIDYTYGELKGTIELPPYEFSKPMYKGMEPNKVYTVWELEI